MELEWTGRLRNIDFDVAEEIVGMDSRLGQLRLLIPLLYWIANRKSVHR